MGGAQRAKLSPLAVASQAHKLVKAHILPRAPLWYQPVIDTPPMADLARRPAQAHQGRVDNKPADIREIQAINRGHAVYFRKRFYKEHPWELARPKILVEEDGADYVRQDWSRMEQFAKPLDGERSPHPHPHFPILLSFLSLVSGELTDL
jgi:small subunit ribosomal protein S23